MHEGTGNSMLDTNLGPVSLKGLSFERKLVRLTHLVPEVRMA